MLKTFALFIFKIIQKNLNSIKRICSHVFLVTIMYKYDTIAYGFKGFMSNMREKLNEWRKKNTNGADENKTESEKVCVKSSFVIIRSVRIASMQTEIWKCVGRESLFLELNELKWIYGKMFWYFLGMVITFDSVGIFDWLLLGTLFEKFKKLRNRLKFLKIWWLKLFRGREVVMVFVTLYIKFF